METTEIDEILEIFEGYREKFPYRKDGFALTRLLDETGEGKSVAEIKKGPNGRFLNLPLIRDFISRIGDGQLTPDQFLFATTHATDLYLVTLDKWGNEKKYWTRSWDQMARPGFNLVIQLNLSNKHLEKIRRVDHDLLDYMTPQFSDHPVRDDGLVTVSWARIDMDVMSGVALIEEIQSDWIRETGYLRNRVKSMSLRDNLSHLFRHHDKPAPRKSWLKYLEGNDFHRMEKHWAEATLEATCQFLKQEIGITDIYLYDFETGNRFKGMKSDYYQPPRSLYTSLPKRYGMKRVNEVPAFLLKKTDRHLRKAMRAAPSIFWKMSDKAMDSDDPPGFGPGQLCITGSSYSLLPALTIQFIIYPKRFH